MRKLSEMGPSERTVAIAAIFYVSFMVIMMTALILAAALT